MATKKKVPASKKAPAKAPVKAPIKARATKAKKAPELKSFKVSKDPIPFSSMKITRQTVYWVVLVAFIIFCQLWIIKLQLDISELTNSIVTIQDN